MSLAGDLATLSEGLPAAAEGQGLDAPSEVPGVPVSFSPQENWWPGKGSLGQWVVQTRV